MCEVLQIIPQQARPEHQAKLLDARRLAQLLLQLHFVCEVLQIISQVRPVLARVPHKPSVFHDPGPANDSARMTPSTTRCKLSVTVAVTAIADGSASAA